MFGGLCCCDKDDCMLCMKFNSSRKDCTTRYHHHTKMTNLKTREVVDWCVECNKVLEDCKLTTPQET